MRILHLDDNPADLQLIRALIDEAYHELSASVESVSTKEAYLFALRSHTCDLILSDHRMSGYDGDEALKDARVICPDIPFIMVTGELGEERAVETLKAGATDYVLKDRLRRLVPSIKRALKDAALERERREKDLLLAKTHQERKRAESTLQYHASLVETVSDAIVSTDKELIIRSWNKAAERLYGWRAGEVIGLKGSDILQTSFPKGVTREAITRAIFEQGSWEGELIQKTKAGDAITVQARSVALKDEAGNVIGGVSVSHDVTERKRAEEQLERSNQRLNQILTSIQEDFYVIDRNWTFVYANERFTSRLGKQPEDFVGRNMWEMFPKHVGSVLGENFRAAMDKRELRRFEMTGEYTDAIYSVTVYPSPEGITVLGSEITERKRAEQALRKSEERFRSLAENLPSVLMRYDRHFRVVYLSPTAEAFTGISVEQFLGKTNREVGMPEDLCTVWEEAMEEVFRTGENQDVEFSFQSGQGLKTFFLRFAPEKAADGTIDHVLGISTDITERTRVQEALAASERKHRELLETANSIIIRWDNQGIIRFINEYGLRFLGYRPEELLGRDVMTIVPKVELSSGRDLEALVRDIVKRPELYTYVPSENIRKDGTTAWVIWTNKAILDEHGEVREILAIGNDITALKEAEEARRLSEENLRLMVNQATDAMMIIDSDGVIEAVSGLGALLLGYDEGELVGKHASDFAVTFSRLEATLTLAELRKNAPRSKTVSARIKTKSGQTQLMGLMMRLLNAGTKAEKYFLKFSRVDLPGK